MRKKNDKKGGTGTKSRSQSNRPRDHARFPGKVPGKKKTARKLLGGKYLRPKQSEEKEKKKRTQLSTESHRSVLFVTAVKKGGEKARPEGGGKDDGRRETGKRDVPEKST